MSEIKELREEIRRLREEIASLRLTGVSHYHYQAPVYHYVGPAPVYNPYNGPPGYAPLPGPVYCGAIGALGIAPQVSALGQPYS